MLRWFQIARLALNHSPEKEQRLLAFSASPQHPDATNDASLESLKPGNDVMSSFLSNVTLSERQRFHDAVFTATDLETQQKVLQEYLPNIKEKIGEIGEGRLSGQELNDVMERTRISIVDDLNREETDRNQLATALGKIDTSKTSDEQLQALIDTHRPMIEKYFELPKTLPSHQIINLLQALLARDIERVRKQERKTETGILWNNLRADEFEKLYRKFRKIPANEAVRLPNAFSYGNTMVFNIEHEDFRKEGLADTLAERAAFHEATHLALTNTEPKYDISMWTRMLKGHAEWKNLAAAVERVFSGDNEYLSGGKKNERIVSEALAIFMANRKVPINSASIQGNASVDAQKQVCDILEKIFADPTTGYFDVLRKHLEGTVDRFTEVKTRNGTSGAPLSVGSLLMQAAKDAKVQETILSDLESKNRETEEGVETNADQGVHLAEKNLEQAAAASEGLTAATLHTKIESLLTKLENIRGRYPALQAIIEGAEMDSEKRQQLLATVSQNLEYLSQSGSDLILLKKRADTLNRWSVNEEDGGLSIEEKSAFAESSGFPTNPYRDLQTTMEAADALCKPQLDEALQIMKGPVSGYETIFDEMTKEIDDAQEKGQKTSEGSGTDEESVAAWLKKNVFSSQGDVVWLTPLNIMNIIKTYKDAIVQNYNSNQKVKENRVAKKLNFYTPIQHTLKKLARSTDHTESSEFKEYIEKEGYTFDEVFGRDGKGKSDGLLFQNRHNFNRAKAVLEYAADKAWMYFLDPLNGHDVYGIDYQGIEGHQSFEELVAKHEAGKSHEIQHGYDRVDKMPDVQPMMDTMVHELRHKNIFAVQGIMKRLQDKAKFSHSNTWLLTTLLMLIRDESKDDPTLKLCLDKGMIDNISNHTIQQSAWSITWLKMLRHPIDRWKSGQQEFTDDNILTETMEKIEQKLAQCGANYPDTPEGRLMKYEAIAFVLAGKTLHLGNSEASDRGLFSHGWNKSAKISIFEPDFDEYRHEYSEATSQSTCSPKETDNDYFNAEVGGSDIMLLNQTGFEKILIKDSTGKWTLAEKAVGFLAQLFERYDELQAIDPEAHRKFSTEIREKLSYWWNVMDDSRKQQFHENEDQRGRKIYEEILKRKMFNGRALGNLKKILGKHFIDTLDGQEKITEKQKLDALFAQAA